MSFCERVVDVIAADMFGPPGSDKSAPDIFEQRDMAGRALYEACKLIDRAIAQPLDGGPEAPLEEIAGIIVRHLGGPEQDAEWAARARTAASHLWDKVTGWIALHPGVGEGSASPGSYELLWGPDPRIHPAYLKAARAVVDFHFGLLADRISIQPEGPSAAAVGERGKGFTPWEAMDDEEQARVEEVMLDKVRTLDVEAWLKRYPDPRPGMAERLLRWLQNRAIGLEREVVFPLRVAALAAKLVERGSLTQEEVRSLFLPASARSAEPAKTKKGPGGSPKPVPTVRRVSNYPCCGGEARFQVPLPNPRGRADHQFAPKICPRCGEPFRVSIRVQEARYSGRLETCQWRPFFPTA